MAIITNSEVIDLRVAGQLIAHKRMGQSAFERLVPVFLDESHMLVSQIRCAIAASDNEGLRLTAHKLKGSASVIGAAQVRDAAQNLMVQIDERKMPSAEQLQHIEQVLADFQVAAATLIGR
jgi:HPt (histidine-containing phosphotransfer) domain-containing protein